MNLLNEKSLDKIAESAGARLWKGFVTFGSASAGILAIFIITRLIKLIIDTYINMDIHIHGCGIYLFATIWNSVIYLFLYVDKSIKTGQANQNENQQQIETFLTTKEPRYTSPSISEDHRPAHKVPHTISIMDEVKSYNELHKLLDRNYSADTYNILTHKTQNISACKMLKLAVSTFFLRGQVLRPPPPT